MWWTVEDEHEHPLEAGDRVRLGNWPRAQGETLSHAEAHGTITKITEPDGDVDDEGRPFGIPPHVHVKFDDGCEDSFIATMRWQDGPYICDDVTLESPYEHPPAA